MKPAFSNFLASSAIALSRSGANTHFFYRMGEEARFTFSLWTMTEGSITGMSSWLHANTS